MEVQSGNSCGSETGSILVSTGSSGTLFQAVIIPKKIPQEPPTVCEVPFKNGREELGDFHFSIQRRTGDQKLLLADK